MKKEIETMCDDIYKGEDWEPMIDYITNLQEELKSANESIIWWRNRYNGQIQINEEHRKINGKLRKTINEAIDYLEYQISQLDFEKDTKAKMLGSMVLVLLQGSDE